ERVYTSSRDLFNCLSDHRYLHSFPTRALPIWNTPLPYPGCTTCFAVLTNNTVWPCVSSSGRPRVPGLLRSRISRRLERWARPEGDRKSTRLNSSHVKISYAVFRLKKKNANDVD